MYVVYLINESKGITFPPVLQALLVKWGVIYSPYITANGTQVPQW
jgi:hypothetical protein